MKNILLFSCLAMMAFYTVSCNKDDDNTPDSSIVVQETDSEEYAVEIDAIADEGFDMMELSQLKSGNVGYCYLTDCAVVTLDESEAIKVLTIDFGTGCVGADGKVRTGKIIVTTESFTETNKLRTFLFDGYTVSGNAVTGSIVKTITNDMDANSRLAGISEDITIALAGDKGTLTRSADLTRLYEFGTLGAIRDNKFTTWGTTLFTSSQGRTVTKTVDEETPLLYKTACRQVVSGTKTIDFGNGKVWTVNFGDGTCDHVATITDGENTWLVWLRK
ncbi:MAG: hypothetical protein QM786_00625 [Breznakibacter sp.]